MSPDTLPSRIGGCELGEMLGQGGVGAVYRATQVSLARAVAVKILQRLWDPALFFLALLSLLVSALLFFGDVLLALRALRMEIGHLAEH